MNIICPRCKSHITISVKKSEYLPRKPKQFVSTRDMILELEKLPEPFGVEDVQRQLRFNTLASARKLMCLLLHSGSFGNKTRPPQPAQYYRIK